MQLSGQKIQASEVFKYTYDGKTDYGFSFAAPKSGLVEKSHGLSHTGNYEVIFKGPAPIKKVPEPGIMVGLVGLGGLIARKRNRSK